MGNWDKPPAELKAPPADDTWRKSPAKKNLRQWCKGHEGRPHQTEVRPSKWDWPCAYRKGRWLCNHELVCTVCGKLLSWGVEDCPDKPEAGGPQGG
jgi:hypothetical protein